MKLFITGATGFVGRRLTKRLLEEGHDLTLLVRREPEEALYRHPKVQLVRGELEDCSAWQDALQGQEWIIHLAAPLVFGQTGLSIKRGLLMRLAIFMQPLPALE